MPVDWSIEEIVSDIFTTIILLLLTINDVLKAVHGFTLIFIVVDITVID